MEALTELAALHFEPWRLLGNFGTHLVDLVLQRC
jgi:hypothetical protein